MLGAAIEPELFYSSNTDSTTTQIYQDEYGV